MSLLGNPGKEFKPGRRAFLAGTAACALLCWKGMPTVNAGSSRFRVCVLTDEITQDFGRALEIAGKEFGLGWVELRGMWNKNLLKLDDAEVAEAARLLARQGLRVSDIASPLFKVFWPGVPESALAHKQHDQFGADFSYEQQDEVLERSLELCRVFKTDRLRVFDFWRIRDASPYREAMDEKLRSAARKAAKHSVFLLLENEPACNTATSVEAARTLAAVREPNFLLNWDPGNAAAMNETAFPDGYERLPKDRIGHVHCKDLVRASNEKGYEWAAMGEGIVDWAGQFKALRRDGYSLGVSLETHWRGAGTAEESTRRSLAGMKRLLREAGEEVQGKLVDDVEVAKG